MKVRRLCMLCVFMLNSCFMNMLYRSYELNLDTDYSQFYLVDGDRGLSQSLWLDEEDFFSRIDSSNGIIVVRTERSGVLRVIVDVVDKKPELQNQDSYDHIVECSIEITSGHFMIKDCPDFQTVKDMKLPSGYYRVRICSANLSTVDSDYSGNDYYTLVLWKEEKMSEKTVVKQYID